MRTTSALTAAALLLTPMTITAQQPAPPAPAVPAPATPAPAFSTAATTIGDLIDNPATREILVRHLPGITENPNVEQARTLTLRAAQAYAPEMLPSALLDAIDRDLAALPAPTPTPAG